MHELSIAMSIVDMAQEEAERRNVQVDAVHLDLGALSGVVKEALLFSYGVACDGTLLEGSRLVVTDIPDRGLLSGLQGAADPQIHAVVLLPRMWNSNI